MLPSPHGCRLGPRGYSLSRPQCAHCCYGPVTRGLPWGGLVDRLQSFSFHHLCYPNYGALTLTPAGLSPAEHASLRWTHNRARGYRSTRTGTSAISTSRSSPSRSASTLPFSGAGGRGAIGRGASSCTTATLWSGAARRVSRSTASTRWPKAAIHPLACCATISPFGLPHDRRRS